MTPNLDEPRMLGEHAVVIGAGMAGLLTARVLSDFYRWVSVIERDTLPEAPAHRKGVPQGRHLHTWLSRGSQAIGELFPGLLDELREAGAEVADDGDLSRAHYQTGRHVLNRVGRFADPAALVNYQASRPFLEFHVGRRVWALGNVTLLGGHDVIEPILRDGAITGVRIAKRDNGIESELSADLLVDAGGRGTRTPAFLDSAGYGLPAEKRNPMVAAYASQMLAVPSGRIAEQAVAILRQGRGKPAVVFMAYENDRSMLTVGRVNDDSELPTDFDGMLRQAKPVVPSAMHQELRTAEPVGKVAHYRSAGDVWRRYEAMDSFPKGLLVIGDALCSFNPIYAQGMTVASLQALALRDCLADGDEDLASRFFGAAAEHIAPVWEMNQARDQYMWPDPAKRRPLIWRLRDRFVEVVLRAAAKDIAVTEQMYRVNNLVDPPTRLQEPSLLRRVLVANLR